MKKAFAIFDVDKTIIKGDSMFYFLLYGISKKPWLVIYLPIITIKVILFKAGILDVKKAKESLYIPIKHLKEEEIQEFYEKVLLKKSYGEVLNVLKEHKKSGSYTILVSASPEEYLKYFKNKDYIDEVIGTKLLNVNGRYINKIQGENCKDYEKVKRINTFLKENNFEIDFENSYCYGDSNSDSYMMNLVKNRYRVRGGSLEEFSC
ncbi:HAD-superfamily subfamily IB hydrolase, TIGR01490 [Clostridium cavendishii DSM 21758]|uniref:HAD-superfamily subfamily IB hydrolase, TIGR01490 n=1 Tax=Clostridium cavendishii DSM 21758 TaxID=1121302 RepID=A0A1M6UNI1_9CLOT|nr:HAD-IB family hydrolase [Clostridium cavendishii]SHK70673.1 HAD-superfamily subfamily IB hydrolase, TIGR01490 [Clostridium cavendishii DSM 21758]